MTAALLLLLAALLLTAAPPAGLSGNWVFEAQTGEGTLRAGLTLARDGKKLSATLRIDNHVLKGEGKTDGTRFEVLLAHADGEGPGHQERLLLQGRLEDGRIAGSWDSGDARGAWTGRRNTAGPESRLTPAS